MFLSSGWDSLKERLDDLLPAGSLRARFARGAFWSTTGMVVAQALGLAASVIVARIFDSKELYGELGMIRNTVVMFGVFAGLGLGLTATKHVAEFRATDPARAGRVLGMANAVALISSAAMAIAVFLFARWIVAYTLKAPRLETELRIGCVILFFEALNGAQLGALSGFEAFRSVAWLSFYRGILTFPLMVVGTWAGMRWGPVWAVRGALAALAAAAAAGWVMNHFALRSLMREREVPFASWREARTELPLLWTYALPALLNGALATVAAWASMAVLVRRNDSGSGAFGVFSAANQWQFPVTLVAGQLGAVLLPILASFQREEGGDARGARAVEAATVLVAVALLPLVAILSCFAGPIMSLYGAKFAPYVWVFWAALFVAGAKSLGTIPGTLIQAKGAMWAGFVINLTWGVALILFVWFWADRGPEGYANAFSCAYAILTVGGLLYCRLIRLCTWSLVLKIWLVTACLAGLTYGMGLTDRLWLRLAIFVAASAASLAWGGAAWKRHRANWAAAIPDAPMDAPPCPVCGGPSAADGTVLTGHVILACPSCGHRFARSEMLPGESYEQLYTEGSYKKGYVDAATAYPDEDVAGLPTYMPFFRNVRAAEHPRLLDVACGTGRFCKAAAARGWDVTGIDVSAEAVSVASRTPGGRFFAMPMERAAQELGGFDAVTAFEFVEHTSDPLAAVEGLKGMARAGGVVLVTVPNWESPQFQRTENPEWVPPVHNQFFTACSLRTLLERAGLVDVRVEVIRRRWKVRGPRSLFRAIWFRIQTPVGLYGIGRRA